MHYPASMTTEICHRFSPDYQKELWKVYASVTELALNAGSFEMFSLAGYHKQLADVGNKNAQQLLPSWVPNLSGSSSFITTRKYHERGYAAGTSRPLQFEIIPQTRQLPLKGVRFDTIKQCLEPVGSYSLIKILAEKISTGQWEDVGEVAAIYRHSLKHAVQMLDGIPRTYHGGISRNEALWSTVVEDYDGANHPVSPTVGDGFQGTLLWLRFFEILVDAETLDDTSTLKRFFCHERLGQFASCPIRRQERRRCNGSSRPCSPAIATERRRRSSSLLLWRDIGARHHARRGYGCAGCRGTVVHSYNYRKRLSSFCLSLVCLQPRQRDGLTDYLCRTTESFAV